MTSAQPTSQIPSALDPHVIRSGHLPVGDGHEIYWEDWGNSAAAPIFCLHGGPGGGFSASHKSLFDPARHHVIFHDQRGCGQSQPFASIEHNTTQDLIADIEKLRQHLQLGKIAVVGGSWGSTLALAYAIAHPEQVTRLMLWSIYLARQADTDYVSTGYARFNFPQEWEHFIALVPANQRHSGDAITQAYFDLIQSSDAAVAAQAAVQWTRWESTLITLNYDSAKLDRELAKDPNVRAIALLEMHYFLHHCFMPENYILDQINKIKSIPCAIIHGRFDACTPASTALDLFRAYGPAATLQWVNSSHLRSEPEMLAALRATVNTF